WEKKKTGTTSTNICNFLVQLQDHCPTESIIVMDNAQIHGGIEFLPKYSPFLNPIKLVFNIIKIDVKNKEIQSKLGLAEAIRELINDKMTPEICSKSFLHFQKFYS
ncbi:hypothetical protein VP01_15642g1, partial [Puccinia sorghi]